MIWIKKLISNDVVTGYYLDLIGYAFEQIGCSVTYSYDMADIQPKYEDVVIAGTATDALKAYQKCKRIIFWAQGVWPEESFMRNNNRLRFYLTSAVEKWALKHALFVFFVSNTLKEHYEKKYGLNFDGRFYIMPCSNEELHKTSFFAKEKYLDNVFCYAGSTSVWQCFEETIALYKKIEEKHPDSKLLLLVKDRETALACIRKYNVQNYEIDFVPVSKLPDVLKTVKFGFVLRKPSVVNSVATPTKILTYLANGLIPIYSASLEGIHDMLKESEFCIRYENDGDLSAIEKYMTEQVSSQEVFQEYERIYKTHYARETHLARLKNVLAPFGRMDH